MRAILNMMRSWIGNQCMIDDTSGGRWFVNGDIAWDEMVIRVGDLLYGYIGDEAIM